MLIEQIQQDPVATAARARHSGHFKTPAVVEFERSHLVWELFTLDETVDAVVHGEVSIVKAAMSNTVAYESAKRS